MPETSSHETESIPDFNTRFIELVTKLDEVRMRTLIETQPDRFSVNIHPLPLPTNPEIITAERAVIEHVITSQVSFDEQAVLLEAVGLCNQIPNEKEYVLKSGLAPGVTLQKASRQGTIESSNAVFLLNGPAHTPVLKVGISYFVGGEEHLMILDDHAKPISPIALRILP